MATESSPDFDQIFIKEPSKAAEIAATSTSTSEAVTVKLRSDYEIEMVRKTSQSTGTHLLAPCIYANCGCKELVTRGSWLEKDHFEVCPFRPLPCLLRNGGACTEQIPYYDYIFHLQSQHMLFPSYTTSLVSKIVIRKEEFEKDGGWTPKWLSAWGLHFFLHLVRKTPGIWSSWVTLYDGGSGLDPATFLARITYYKELRSVGGIYPVQTARADHSELEMKRAACLLTSDETMREVCQIKDNFLTDLSVHVEIVKYDGPPPQEIETIGVTTEADPPQMELEAKTSPEAPEEAEPEPPGISAEVELQIEVKTSSEAPEEANEEPEKTGASISAVFPDSPPVYEPGFEQAKAPSPKSQSLHLLRSPPESMLIFLSNMRLTEDFDHRLAAARVSLHEVLIKSPEEPPPSAQQPAEGASDPELEAPKPPEVSKPPEELPQLPQPPEELPKPAEERPLFPEELLQLPEELHQLPEGLSQLPQSPEEPPKPTDHAHVHFFDPEGNIDDEFTISDEEPEDLFT